MTEPTPNPAPAPEPAPAPSPAPAPAAAQRPEYVPEKFWDPQTNAVKAEFGQHYGELATFKQTHEQQQEALKARKPEDIKIEAKLPPDLKLPDGMEFKIDEKDPRIPVLRDLALKRGLDQDTINELIVLDAQQKIAAHTAEMERVKAEDAKLGANVKQRKDAAAAWVAGFNGLKPEHKAEIEVLTATAAGVELLEMLMAKASGSVPGTGDPPPPKPAEVTIEQRWYGPAQQKAS